MSGRRLMGLVLLYPALVFADIPHSADDLSSHTMNEIVAQYTQAGAETAPVLHLIAELNGANTDDVLQAARALAKQADENIIFAILRRADDEIRSATPQINLAAGLVEIVGQIASEKYIPVLQSLTNLVEANQSTLGRGRRILRRVLGQAAGHSRSRAEIISSSVSPSRDAAQASYDSGLPSGFQTFWQYLTETAAEHQEGERFGKNQMPPTPEGFLLKSLSRDLTDEIRAQRRSGGGIEFGGRDEEISRALQVMVRMQGKLPIMAGGSGVGKTTAVYMMAEDVFAGKYPDSNLFHEQLKNAEFLLTSPAKISQMALSNQPTAQAAAVELLFEAVRQTQAGFQKKYNAKKPLIVVIDNIQTLDPPQLAALKQELENTADPICVIGTALSAELDLKLKTVAGIEKDVEKVPLREFSTEETRAVLNQTWAPVFRDRYNVTFDNDTLDAIFRVSAYLKPNLALPEAPLRALEDVAIATHAANPNSIVHLSEKNVYDFAQKITRLPVDPRDAAGFSSYLENVRGELHKHVINQERLITAAMDALERVLANNPKRPASVLFMGPTGVGKTLVGETLAEVAFHDKNRFFRIDGTSLQDGKFALGSIFGVPIGVKGAEQSSGTFMEWLDDPARGKYGGVILIDEADKMHLDVWQRLMEFQSGGVIYGGDGKPRYANRHIVIFTSNKGAKVIFPDAVLDWSQAEIEARASSVTEDQLRSMLQKPDPNAADREATILPAEVVGRIQRAALALPVTRTTAPDVAHVEMAKYTSAFKSNYGITVNMSADVEKYMAQTGINYLSGARPLGDQIDRFMTPALTEARKTWRLPKNATIQVGLKPAAPGAPAKLLLTFDGQTIEAAAPAVKVDNPLLDPNERDMLAHLAERMHEHMPEQPEAIDAIVESIKGKLGDVGRRRPISITVAGRTGLGKTELGKALAYARYGSDERFSAIPLSDVTNETGWWKIFVPQFEQALMDNPQGGVIILDEFSNIGGKDGANKEMLLKKFLHILEEGVWVSPIDPKRVYDLRNYLFLFTGNDLEKLTQGVTSDEENLEIWRQYHTRAQVEAQLKKNGVPESFISRQDAVAMIKPLIGQGKGNVAGSLLDSFRKRAESQHRGVKITWGDNFASRMGDAFFTHARGARSMRSVNENTVSAMITTSLLKFGYDEQNLSGVELKFSIEDNKPEAAYLPGVNGGSHGFKREVLLTCELFKDGMPRQTLSVDATASAENVIVLEEDEAKMAAYRELGRAYLNDEASTGLKLAYLSVRGTVVDGEPVVGYSRYEAVRPNRPLPLNRKAVIARIKSLWGGRLALEKAGFEPDFGANRIEMDVQQVATDYILKSGTGIGVVLRDSEGRPKLTGSQTQNLQSELDKLYNEAKMQAEHDLEAMWPAVQSGVHLVLDKGHISGEDLRNSSCAQILKN